MSDDIYEVMYCLFRYCCLNATLMRMASMHLEGGRWPHTGAGWEAARGFRGPGLNRGSIGISTVSTGPF